MWLIAGLGNPGPKYARNRHNIGFRVADELCRRHFSEDFRNRMGGDLAAGMIRAGGRLEKALILKPLEFMNRSGFAVQRTLHYYNVEVDHLIVVHDEIDIDAGLVRLKAGGGHGGHNGLRSIVEQLGTSDFLRVRVGIGKPPAEPGMSNADKQRRVVSHVLGDFPSTEEPEVEALVRRASDATEAIIADGIRAAMNAFHKAEASV